MDSHDSSAISTKNMSTKILQNFVDQASRLVQDGLALNPDDMSAAIDSARATHSRHRPLRKSIDLIGDGSGVFNVADLTGYVEEFSGDPEIEFPISTSGDPNPMDRRSWIWYRHPTEALQIRLLGAKPTASQSVRFEFNVLHLIDDSAAVDAETGLSATTIPDADFFAFCKLVAAEQLDQLAQFFTQTGEGTEVTMGGQSFYSTKGKEYEARAKKNRTQYEQHVGVGKDVDVGAASVTKNLDQADSRGRDRLTHKTRYR